MLGELVDPLQLRSLVTSIDSDEKEVVIGRGRKASVGNLLITVGHSASADGEQGDGEFEEHDCMLVSDQNSR